MSDAPVESDGPVPEGLLDAFWRYETALMADDVPVLDALFAPGPGTIRGDAAGLLVGHDAIAAFRRGRGGAPQRRIAAVHVRALGPDTAAVVAELVPATGGRGQQTQVWRRSAEGWQVLVAHVAAPAPAIDSRIWRVVGAPLVAGREGGRLAGQRVAVKDLFAIAGQRIGGGVPAHLDAAPLETTTAPAVQLLLDAGADVTGIARTDEFAYSIAGANPHYGTPPNGRVPGALPGGSSSGPASAVALGQADIGLATDTAGSIRVPASYQGLWGLRTTHGWISREGLLPLAPSFDTVGWLARDPGTLLAAVRMSARRKLGQAPSTFAVAPVLLDGVPEAVRDAVEGWVRDAVAGGRIDRPTTVHLRSLDGAQEAFRTVQAFEAWETHGSWLSDHPDAVSGPVADRFRAAAAVTADDVARARETLDRVRADWDAILGGVLLLLPATAAPAPPTTASPAELDRVRVRTVRLTCIASILRAPSVSAPLLQVGGRPLGLAVVGPRWTDAAIVRDVATADAASMDA